MQNLQLFLTVIFIASDAEPAMVSNDGSLDSITVSLHNPNSRNLFDCHLGFARGLSVAFETW